MWMAFICMWMLLMQCMMEAVDAHSEANPSEDKNCPICNMSAKDDKFEWFVQLKNGQKIYTCGMTSGVDYKKGESYFSHPSLLGATMVSNCTSIASSFSTDMLNSLNCFCPVERFSGWNEMYSRLS